jgi:hypothetical protein
MGFSRFSLVLLEVFCDASNVDMGFAGSVGGGDGIRAPIGLRETWA